VEDETPFSILVIEAVKRPVVMVDLELGWVAYKMELLSCFRTLLGLALLG